MMKKLISGIATASLVASMMAPATLAADNEISGNGPGSTNLIVDKDKNISITEQTNVLEVVTIVGSSASTGDNTVKGNSGASDVDTGDATSTVKTTVAGPSNEATPPDCGCPEGNSNLISGNGPGSTSTIIDKNKNVKVVNQTNGLGVLTVAGSSADTGGNKVKNNSGKSDVKTGNATSRVKTKVKAPTNVVH